MEPTTPTLPPQPMMGKPPGLPASGFPPAAPPSIPPVAPASPVALTPPAVLPAAPVTLATPLITTQHIEPKRSSTPMIIGIVVLLVLLGFAGYFFINKKNTAMMPLETPAPSTEEVTDIGDSSAPDAIPAESPDGTTVTQEAPRAALPEGYLAYSNSVFGFGFDYPQQLIDPCQDGSCVKLPSSGVYVGADLSIAESATDVKHELMTADLLCSADGPNGSVSCVNTKVEDLVSDLGTQGYKVIRTSTVEDRVKGTTVKNTEDVVYYFKLLKPITNSYGTKFTGVIVTAFDHDPMQVVAVDALAKTFRLQ